MEEKLLEYRAKKAREERINKVKSKFQTFLDRFKFNETKKPSEYCDDESSYEPLVPPDDSNSNLIETASIISNDDDIDDNINCFTYLDLIYYAFWFLLWVTVYILFIEFQFGTVYLIVSGLLFMYFNTRTGPKRPGEVSAYSVFNRNCESINGTLKAEQFEREIRYGHGAVR